MDKPFIHANASPPARRAALRARKTPADAPSASHRVRFEVAPEFPSISAGCYQKEVARCPYDESGRVGEAAIVAAKRKPQQPLLCSE